MKTIVVDTSALVRLYVPDGPIPDGLEEAVESAWRAEAVLLAPELALAEVGQVLHKKAGLRLLSADEVDEILSAVLDLPIDLVGHRELLQKAIEYARSYELTVYDALFLTLAGAHQAQLISADDELMAAWQKANPDS